MRNILPLSLFLLSGTASAIALPWPQIFPGSSDNIITVDGEAVAADATGFAVGTVTVQPGGPEVTVFGTPLSLAADGELVVGSSTTQLAKLEKRRKGPTKGGKTTTPKGTITTAPTTPATTSIPTTSTTQTTSSILPLSSTTAKPTSASSSAPAPVSSSVSQLSSTSLSASSATLSQSTLSQSSSGVVSSSGSITSGIITSGSGSITSAPSGSSSTVPSGSSSASSSRSSGISSSSASGASSAVIIFPKTSAAAAAKSSLSAELQKQLGAANFHAVDSKNSGIVEWTANVNSSYIATLQKNAVVDSIVPNVAAENPLTEWKSEETEAAPVQNKTSGIDSNVGIVYDNSTLAARALVKRAISKDQTVDDDWDLRMLCQPNVKKMAMSTKQPLKYNIDDYDSYFYDSTAGEGITVYLHDTGLNIENAEVKKFAHTPRWLFPTSTSSTNTDKNDLAWHGTCMASKIVGPTVGVAKKAQLVIVKFPPYNKETKAADNMAALAMILDDVKTQKKANANFKAVVNLSWGMKPAEAFTDATARAKYESQLRNVIQNLFNEGVVVITSAGNDANINGGIIDKWPTILESSTFPLINVGNVNRYGQRASNSEYGPQLTVMAPGDHVRCASTVAGVDLKYSYGTSEAAAHVSGLVAYLLALDPKGQFGKQTGANVAKTMKKYLQDTSFNRANDGAQWAEATVKVGVVSNGVSYKDMGLK